jgi:hypothetical protein
MDHRSTDPGDHTPGPWGKLPEAEAAQHGCEVWRRDCSGENCSWAQCTTIDPADKNHPEANLVRTV